MVVEVDLGDQLVGLDLAGCLGEVRLQRLEVHRLVLHVSLHAITQAPLDVGHQVPAHPVKVALQLQLAGLNLLTEGALSEGLGDRLLALLAQPQALGGFAQDVVAAALTPFPVLVGESFGTGQNGFFEL